MALFKDIHQRKAAIKTGIIMLLLLLSFFFIGMTYMDPPEEKGIVLDFFDDGAEANYGTSNSGSGEIQPMTTEIPINQPKQNNADSNPKDSDPTLTQENEEAPVVKPKTKPVNTKPKTQNPDKSTSDALNNILGAPSNTNQSSTGEGNDGGKGDKGQIDGNPYATAYYGNGTGSGTGYGLNGRNKTSNQKFSPECDEEGRVVVQIEVDRSGKVINAMLVVKNSTNTASCLVETAIKTALSYRFNADSKAPTKQIGFVVINFTLGQ